MLRRFIVYIEKKVGIGLNFNMFEHRVKIQKYVYLAKSLGWNFDYNYGMYLRGPYSEELANDYHDIEPAGNPGEPERGLDYSEDFDIELYEDLIRGKETCWLEVAATILSLFRGYASYYKNGEARDMLVHKVKLIKSSKPKKFIREVMDDLEDRGLISF